MAQLTMAGQLLLGLAILVFIHELGHYLAARAFGIKIEKFYIFFDFGNFKLFSTKIGDTEYGVGWFPLGGYVKIAGMIDESMDKEQLTQEVQPWEFRAKPAWQRFIVMIAGISMNIILGVIIFAFWLMYYQKAYIKPEDAKEGIYAYEMARSIGFEHGDRILTVDGKKIERIEELNQLYRFQFGAAVTVLREGREVELLVPKDFIPRFETHKGLFIDYNNDAAPVIDSVRPELPAALADLKKGDRIIEIDEVPVKKFGDYMENLRKNAGKEISIMLVRNNDTLTKQITLTKEGRLGTDVTAYKDYKRTSYNLLSAFYFGAKDGYDAIYFTAIGLGKLFTGEQDVSSSVQSPIGIAKIYGGNWVWAKFWKLTGLISFVLAFMNFLPIPALDGGHVVFILIEMIQGKPVSDKVLERAQVVGMVLILSLMVYAFGNDLYKEYFK